MERAINEQYLTSGHKGYLQGHFIHHPFQRGVAHWLHRHNQYSSMEAQALAGEIRGRLSLRDLFAREPATRRRSWKQLAYRLPCRPFLVFCYLYLLRLGFLDGRAGLAYCRLRMIYEYMIDLKITELRRRQEGLPV